MGAPGRQPRACGSVREPPAHGAHCEQPGRRATQRVIPFTCYSGKGRLIGDADRGYGRVTRNHTGPRAGRRLGGDSTPLLLDYGGPLILSTLCLSELMELQTNKSKRY